MIKKTKEFKNKIKFKQNTGITLIALVITIIVLLILAGISISMLSGDNGILQKATDAKTQTIHANVLEQMQLETNAYTIDKTTGNTSSTLIDFLKEKSIITAIDGEEEKWQINIEKLLGSKQSMGNGTATKDSKEDVYLLEEQPKSTGSINNVKVATTTPIKIAATTNDLITYRIVYYGAELITIGILEDTIVKNEDNSHTYHLSSPDASKASWDDSHVYLYDENENNVPIIESYNPQANGEPAIINDDGSISLKRNGYYNGGKDYSVSLNIDGQVVTEEFYVYPMPPIY